MAFIMITPQEIIEIKNRLNAEMNRRKYHGSLVSYAGDEYQFEALTPIQTNINKDVYNKLVEPLNAVNSTFNTIAVSELRHIERNDYLDIQAKLTLYESNTIETTNNDCGANCSGLCITQCSTSCTGCTGGCTGTCSGSCQNTCSGTCRGGCSGCGGSCGSSCSGSCSGCRGCGGCDGTCQIIGGGCGLDSMSG